MKTVAVIISGAPSEDNLREVELQPGISAGDVLRALNLTGYLLSREGSNQAFAAEEQIYETVQAGEKLRATPVAEVGAKLNLLRAFMRLLGLAPPVPQIKTRQLSPPIPKVRQRESAVAVAPSHTIPKGRINVEVDRRTLSEIRGWRREGKKLIGAFRTPRGSYVGEISLANPQKPEFFIVNAPAALLNGSHSACFRKRGKGKHFIHFGLSSPELDAGLVAIEKLLAKAN